MNKCNSFGVTRVAAINQKLKLEPELKPELELSNFGADYVARVESTSGKERREGWRHFQARDGKSGRVESRQQRN